MKKYEKIMMHGRFQPFHNGHLSYLDKALEMTQKHLIVAITNPTSSSYQEDKTDDHRHLPYSNPFTFWERYEIINKILKDRVPKEINYTIIPFDIHNYDCFTQIVPNEFIQLVMVLEDWDKKKVKRFKLANYSVIKLQEERIISGEEVRRAISNQNSWKHLVPVATYDYIIQKKLTSRCSNQYMA